jgi:hypothetical protein
MNFSPGIAHGRASPRRPWRLARSEEALGLGAVSINVRITAVRKLAVEADDNGPVAKELTNGITCVEGVASKGEAIRLNSRAGARSVVAEICSPVLGMSEICVCSGRSLSLDPARAGC